MKLRTRKFEIILVIIFFFFSWWLMDKSFGYDSVNHQFRIARHQVGDFGLHLSLIRSFSLGDNFPPELPHFPGRPLPYHYYFDFLVGILERSGVRIDVAFNGLSIFSFTLLLFLIYKIPQIIFEENKFLGLVSVVLFIFHSSLTFLDFIKDKFFSLALFKDLWFLSDYLNKGPFDNSLISIFFTLNVFLNQRHLIAGSVISLSIFYYILSKLLSHQQLSRRNLVILGILLGLSSRIHFLVFLSTSLVLFLLFIFFKRFNLVFLIFIPVGIISNFHLKEILSQDLTHQFFNPGFLAEKPLTFLSFSKFWFLNLGLTLIFIPLGFILSNTPQKKFFWPFFHFFC